MFRSFVITMSVAACSARINDPKAAAPLPDVDKILTVASSKAEKFKLQAVDIQREVVHEQENSYFKIRDHKEAYEARLQAQEQQTKAIARRVEALRKSNRNLRGLSDALEANLTDMREDNRHLRMTLQALGEKVTTASLFVQESVLATVDDEAAVLQVLTPTTEPPTVDSFLAATGSERASLLQVVVPEAPEELVGALSESLSAVEAAEQDAFEQLERQFNISFEEGRSKQAALNATEAQLKGTRARLTDRYTKLIKAEAFLMRKRDALRNRLDALRQFAQKLDIATQSSVEAGEELRTVRKTRAPVLANVSRSNAAPANTASLKANTTLATATRVVAAPAFSAKANSTQRNATSAKRSVAKRSRPAKATLRSSKRRSIGSWIAHKLR